ncbi:hypothetical protein ACFXKD_27855 [Nocardiopsis aegyptia]|uniref:hypothetical protein n=1 Tax=Nocardiopsis aegyptia TaxID=220378 RepID=UPI00366AA1B4
MIDLRLIAYTPNGASLGQLPHPLSIDLGQPLNDLPSLTVSYSTHATGAELLAEPIEVAAEIYDPTTGTWAEQPDSRFVRLARSGDATDPTGARSYTMPGYGWQSRKIRLYPPANPDDLVDGKRGFLSATAGTILRTFLQEWHARGGSTAFSFDFTTAADSAGQPWEKVLTIYYQPGIDLMTVLGNLSDQGVCDWRWNGRTLQAYNPDTVLGRDLSAGPDMVDLLVGRDVTDAPDSGSLEDLVTDVYLQGEGGFALEAHNTAAVSPWGRWEDYLTQGGVRDEGTAIILSEAALHRGARERIQITRGLAFEAAEHLPWRDYRPGDHVRAAADDGVLQSLRVRQITLSRGADGRTTGNVVLNDRFVESEIRRAKRTNGIVNGATASGGSGAQPAPQGPDARRPAAPQGLIVDTTAYLDSDGAARGQITATWGLVDTAADGTAMEIGAYELYHRPNIVGAPWYKATETVHPDNTTWFSGYDVGTEWAFKVRAIGEHNSLPSLFSTVYAVTIAADADPPPVPSTPVLSTRLGVIQVEWDGLGAGGESMPRDFSHVTIEMAPASSGPWAVVDTVTGPGMSVVPNQPYGAERWFRLVSVDRSENASAPSASASITPTQLVSTDVSPGSIGYELLEAGAVRDDILADDAVMTRHVAAGQITGDKIRAYSVTADRIAVGNTKNLLTDPNLNDPDLFGLRTTLSEAHSGGIWSRTQNAETRQDWLVLYRSLVDNGTYRFFYVQSSEAASLNDLSAGFSVDEDRGNVVMRVMVSINDLTAGSVSVTGYVRFLDAFGVNLSNPATFGEEFTQGVFEQEVVSTSGAAIPAGAASAIVYVRVVLTDTPSATTVFLNRPFAATTNGTVLIEDGAVIANKIAANAVTADKVAAGTIEAGHIAANAVVADKIAADAIDGKTITGATVRSAASGQRWIADTAGIRLINGSNQIVANLSSATGDVNAVGIFQSGMTSERAVLSSGVYADRPGTQYRTSLVDDLHPCVFGEGSFGGGSYGIGSLVALSGEGTINSSGRANLVLRRGGNFELVREFAGDQRGVVGSGSDLELHGRHPSGSRSSDFVRAGRISGLSSGGTLTWGQPGVSTPYPMLTAFASSGRSLACNQVSSSSFGWTASANVSQLWYYAFRGGSSV